MFSFMKPKINADCPDFWVATVQFLTGRTREVHVVSQNISDGMVSFLTTDDKHVLIPLSSIETIEFNKDYTKIKERNNAERIRSTAA